MESRHFKEHLKLQKKAIFLEYVKRASEFLGLQFVPEVNFEYCLESSLEEIAHIHLDSGVICISEYRLESMTYEDIQETATHEVAHLIEETHNGKFVNVHANIKSSIWTPSVIIADDEVKKDNEAFTHEKNSNRKISHEKITEIAKKLELETEIMEKLSKYHEENYEVLYFALRKFMSNYLNIYFNDSGYIGIADENYEDLFYWGDMSIHSSDDNLKIGDILHLYQYSSDGEGVYSFHGKVKSFTENGDIRIQHSEDEEIVEISSFMILGKLIKVISFEEDGWEELLCKFIDNHELLELLKEGIEESINLYKSDINVSEKNKMKTISELEKRLVKLKSISTKLKN